MSIGGSSNLGTLLIRRLDSALGVTLSQQSQTVNAARSDAIAQLADAARLTPTENETARPLAETIDKAQAQNERQVRQAVENTKLQAQQTLSRTAHPTTESSSTPSAPTTLGQAAKAILALLSRFPDLPPPVTGRLPLVQTGTSGAPAPSGFAGAPSNAAPSPAGTTSATGPAASSAQATAGAGPSTSPLATWFTQSLSQAVQQSGLFYESHLHDLTFGTRTAATMRLEPQAQPGMQSNPNLAQAATSTQAGASASNTTTAPVNPTPPEAVDSRPGAAGSAPAQPPSPQGASSALAGMHPETHLLVRQQLEVLANQVFAWRGEAWPDAGMQWEVSRRDEEQDAGPAAAHWATRLRLSLPSLGEVEARLSLHDKQVVMQIVAPQSAHTLAQHDRTLRTGFQEAGLTLSQLSILESGETSHDG